MSSMDEVAKAHELFEKGAISEAEFEQVKAGALSAPAPVPGRIMHRRGEVPVEGVAFGRRWALESEVSVEPAVGAALKAVLLPLAVAAGVMAAAGLLRSLFAGGMDPVRMLSTVVVATFDTAPAVAFGAGLFGLISRSPMTSSKRTVSIYAGGAIVATAVCSASVLPLSESLSGLAVPASDYLSYAFDRFSLSSALWATIPLFVICGVCGSWMRRGILAGKHPLDLTRTVLISAGAVHGLAGWLLTPMSLNLGFMIPGVPQLLGILGSGVALAIACLVAGRVRFDWSKSS